MKKISNLFKELFTLKDPPKVIAKGFAIGSFIGMLPIPGLQVIVAFTVAKICKLHTKATCIAVFNTNIFTGAFIFTFNYWLGKTVLNISSTFEIPTTMNMNFFKTILAAGTDVYMSLIVGGILTGIPFAIIAYHSLNYFLTKKQLKTIKMPT